MHGLSIGRKLELKMKVCEALVGTHTGLEGVYGPQMDDRATLANTHGATRGCSEAARQRRMHGGRICNYFVFGNLTPASEPPRLSDITLFAPEPDKGDCYKFGGFGCSSCLNFQISESAAHNKRSLLFVCSLISHSLTLR